MELDLRLGDRMVARAQERDRGRRLSIVYEPDVVAAVGDEIPLLSCSLPTPGPSTPANARAFLEGLLPEGRALEAMAASVRGVRLEDGAPATPRDAALLLAEYGRECAGAIVIVPAGVDYVPGQGTYRRLDETDVGRLVRDLPTHPLGADPDREIRMSLAGAQPKLLLARFGDAWYQPFAGAPSTHILKPTVRWPESAANEALVMRLAQVVGLTPASVWVERIDGISVLVAERYDRRREATEVVRLHQEDLCQALGIRPIEKYRIGRPSERIARLLRRLADSPSDAVRGLLRQVAFRCIVGDEDGHGKNYSVLLDSGHVNLAPLYDSICTLVYPELTGTMATPIGRQVHLAKVDSTALIEEAAAMGIPQAEADRILRALAENLRKAVTEVDAAFTEGWPSEMVIDTILARLTRLESGESMGGPAGTLEPPQRSTGTTLTKRTALPIEVTESDPV